MEAVNVGDKVSVRPGVFMPYWSPGATVIKVGTPEAFNQNPPKSEGGDWVIIFSHGGWLPRSKFVKIAQ